NVAMAALVAAPIVAIFLPEAVALLKIAKDAAAPLVPLAYLVGARSQGCIQACNETISEPNIPSLGGGRIIGRAAGEILDVTKIRIPGPVDSQFGKVDYVLGNVLYNADSV